MNQPSHDEAAYRDYERFLDAQCVRLFGSGIDAIEHPGGVRRKSVRIRLKNATSVICTYRLSQQRTAFEAYVLAKLNRHGAAVPRMLVFDGQLLWQEDLGGSRLSETLDGASEPERERGLASAIDRLLGIYHAADRAMLNGDPYVPELGTNPEWVTALLDRPKVIGDYLGITAPAPRWEVLRSQFLARDRYFVKWDARPGNAMVQPGGTISWFDWEHSGRRFRIDDLVWLLADEAVPCDDAIETRLVEEYLPLFANRETRSEMREYFYGYGTLHICVRLGRLLQKRLEGDNDTQRRYLTADVSGFDAGLAARLCRRGAAWASRCVHTRELSTWFGDIESTLSA